MTQVIRLECGCRPTWHAGFTEPGSFDPECPEHGVPICDACGGDQGGDLCSGWCSADALSASTTPEEPNA